MMQFGLLLSCDSDLKSDWDFQLSGSGSNSLNWRKLPGRFSFPKRPGNEASVLRKRPSGRSLPHLWKKLYDSCKKPSSFWKLRRKQISESVTDLGINLKLQTVWLPTIIYQSHTHTQQSLPACRVGATYSVSLALHWGRARWPQQLGTWPLHEELGIHGAYSP